MPGLVHLVVASVLYPHKRERDGATTRSITRPRERSVLEKLVRQSSIFSQTDHSVAILHSTTYGRYLEQTVRERKSGHDQTHRALMQVV